MRHTLLAALVVFGFATTSTAQSRPHPHPDADASGRFLLVSTKAGSPATERAIAELERAAMAILNATKLLRQAHGRRAHAPHEAAARYLRLAKTPKTAPKPAPKAVETWIEHDGRKILVKKIEAPTVKKRVAFGPAKDAPGFGIVRRFVDAKLEARVAKLEKRVARIEALLRALRK